MAKQVYNALELGVSQAMVNPDALKVIHKLQQNGHDAFIVGGGVRDLLLGRQPKDFDIVTDATPERVRKIFNRNSMIIGRRFRLVHVFYDNFDEERSLKLGRPYYDRHILEVSTYRSGKLHEHLLSEHGRILLDNEYGSQDEDAKRRDFTVNALYYDPVSEQIIDYHNGISDIESRVIKIIGNPYERYLEDPVRVLRAIRLSEKLGLKIDEKTYINFRNVKHLLLNEPRGRLFEEMLKILLSGNALNIIHELDELSIPKRVFGLLDKLFFHGANNEFAYKVLEKTDTRVASGEACSVVFILAGLLWPLINEKWSLEIEAGENSAYALNEVILNAKYFMLSGGITRNLYSFIREIWLLQSEFDAPVLSRLDSILNNRRFRQAWHLFDLRYKFNQTSDKVYNWWSQYITALEENNNELLGELNDLVLLDDKPTKKRKRRRKRKNKAATDLLLISKEIDL